MSSKFYKSVTVTYLLAGSSVIGNIYVMRSEMCCRRSLVSSVTTSLYWSMCRWMRAALSVRSVHSFWRYVSHCCSLTSPLDVFASKPFNCFWSGKFTATQLIMTQDKKAAAINHNTQICPTGYDTAAGNKCKRNLARKCCSCILYNLCSDGDVRQQL